MSAPGRYAALLKQTYAMRPKKGQSLALVTRAAVRLGSPHLDLKYIHVTGTNGKGSVCWKLAQILQEAGFKVGLFTSPHLASYRERLRVNGDPIDEARLVECLEAVLSAMDLEGLLPELSFFEVAVLAAFLHFKQEKVDVVVMEVGIGGRLDPTNIIPPSYLAVLTSVALEHTDYLGDTVEAIAWEKSQIIKDKMPAVVGPRVPMPIVEDRVRTTQSPLYVVPPLAAGTDYEDENRAIVELCVETLLKHHPIFSALTASRSAIESTPPCRFEVWPADRLRAFCPYPNLPAAVVFDAAHNPDALRRLFQRLRQRFPEAKLVGLVSSSADKDVDAAGRLYAEFLESAHVVPVAYHRLLPCRELHDRLTALAKGTGCSVHMYGSGGGDEVAQCRDMLTAVLASAGTPQHVVVVTGSFFIMHPVRAALGFEEPTDPPL